MKEPVYTIDIYQKKNSSTLFCIPCSATIDHSALCEFPVDKIEATASAKDIGALCLNGLARSRWGIDEPGTQADTLVHALGEKTWMGLLKKVRYCQIDRHGNSKTLHFLAGKRLQGGWEMHDVCEVSIDDPKAIGEAILKCLNMFPPK